MCPADDHEALRREAEAVCYPGGFAVTISIPGGEEVARRTFNPHIGVEGGLSVLGTSGIVEPMSQQAILDTIQLEMNQAALRQTTTGSSSLPRAITGWTICTKRIRSLLISRWSRRPTLSEIRWIWQRRRTLNRCCWWDTSASYASWRAAL